MLRAELAGKAEGASSGHRGAKYFTIINDKIIDILTGYIQLGQAAARPWSPGGVHSAATGHRPPATLAAARPYCSWL